MTAAIPSIIRSGLLILLAVTTLSFGGVWPWTGAVLVVGTGVLAFLWLVLIVRDGRLEFRGTPLDLPIVLCLGLILLQLVLGYPFRLHDAELPQRLLAAARSAPAGLPAVPGTLDYHATRWALWYFLAYVGCFYLTIHTLERREHVSRLLLAVVVIAGLTGIYGLLEYLSGNQGLLGWRVAGGGRVRGTFVNPDHFGAFLTLALFAGVGLSLGWGTSLQRRWRSGGHEDGEEESRAPWRVVSRPPQERLFQQVLLIFILALIGTTMVFTLSRGAILSGLLAGAVLAGLLAAHETLGRRRRLAVAATCAIGGLTVWIGLGPVLERFGDASVGWADRLAIYRQATGIVRDFPILGSGVNTFKSVFPRYQALPLSADGFFQYAHSDLLQAVTDMGLVALPLLGWAAWRFFREVALVRVLGVLPAREPGAAAGGGRAARRDPFNLGVALGGLGALVAILVHSAGDFSLRIPANALLLSLILAVTLQAARARFLGLGAEQLAPVREIALDRRRGRLVLVAGLAAVSWLAWTVIGATMAEYRFASAAEALEAAEPAGGDRPWVASTRRSSETLGALEAALRLDPVNPQGHLAVGSVYAGLAVRAWNSGLSESGRLLVDPAQRTGESEQTWAKAVQAFSRAAYLAPMDRRAWGEIGWAHAALAFVPGSAAAGSSGQASVAAFARGMALRPRDPHPFRLQADCAFRWAQAQRGSMPAEKILASDFYRIGAQATRRLVELQPAFLPEALNRALLFSTSFAALHDVLPFQAPDFFFAARLLEAQGLADLSHQALQRAVELAADEDKPIFYRHLAADLIKGKDYPGAVRLLGLVLGLDPRNAEARILLADALARQKQDLQALREYQAAVEIAAKGPAIPVSLKREMVQQPSERSRLDVVEDLLRDRGLGSPNAGRDGGAVALAALAGFQEQRGHPNLAIPLWEQALARSPGDAQVRFGYAESLDAIGAWIPAQGEFRRALELAPRDVGMRLRLAERYVDNGLSEQAIALWQEVTRIRPASLEAYARLATSFEKLGRRKDAELQYDLILRLEPGNATARAALARLRSR